MVLLYQMSNQFFLQLLLLTTPVAPPAVFFLDLVWSLDGSLPTLRQFVTIESFLICNILEIDDASLQEWGNPPVYQWSDDPASPVHQQYCRKVRFNLLKNHFLKLFWYLLGLLKLWRMQLGTSTARTISSSLSWLNLRKGSGSRPVEMDNWPKELYRTFCQISLTRIQEKT